MVGGVLTRGNSKVLCRSLTGTWRSVAVADDVVSAEGDSECKGTEKESGLKQELVVRHGGAIDQAQQWAEGDHDPANELDRRSDVAKFDFRRIALLIHTKVISRYSVTPLVKKPY